MSAITKMKYVRKEVTEEFPLPTSDQNVSKILKPRGNNLHEIMLSTGETCLASMPVKFRKHVWVKRGDFVITEPIIEGKKVRAEIVSILMKEQVKYIKENNLWPNIFKDPVKLDDATDNPNKSESDSEDDLLFKNPNRKIIYYDESDSSSEEESTDDENDSSSEDEATDVESDSNNEAGSSYDDNDATKDEDSMKEND